MPSIRLLLGILRLSERPSLAADDVTTVRPGWQQQEPSGLIG